MGCFFYSKLLLKKSNPITSAVIACKDATVHIKLQFWCFDVGR